MKEFRSTEISEAALHPDTSPLEIRKILVGTDYSEPAYRALEAAVTIAVAYNSDITVAHATSSVAFAAGEGVVPDLLIDQALKDEEQMEILVHHLPAMAQLRVET